MDMDASRGIRKMSQSDECISAPFNPTFEDYSRRPVFPIKGFNDPNYPMQLSTHSLKFDYSHPIPPKLCTIKAYGSTANPTSNHTALSSHMSQWRLVAVGKPTGLLPSVPYGMDDQTSGRGAYEVCRRMGCLDEDAVAQMNLPFLNPQASVVRQLFA